MEESDGEAMVQEQRPFGRRVTSVEIGRRARVVCWIFGVTLIAVGGAATFLTSNQAGTTALILLGGLLAFIAITKRVPLLLEVGSTKIDSSYEDEVFEAGRESVDDDADDDLIAAVEDPPSPDLVGRYLADGKGFRGAIAARAGGVTYRQLDYWARTELVSPSIVPKGREGHTHLYSVVDIVLIRTTKVLLDSAISLQSIRRLIDGLRAVPAEELPLIVAVMQDGEWMLRQTEDEAVLGASFIEPAIVVPLGPIVKSVVAHLSEITRRPD